MLVVQHTLPKGAPVFDAGTPGWQLHPEIARRPRDHSLSKAYASAFAGTDFGQWLTAQGIDTLSIVGYMTHNCDASTALEAAHRGYKVELLSDASGALPYANDAGVASAEEIHRVFTVVFHTNFAAVTTTDAWLKAVAAGKPLPVDDVPASNQRARQARAAA